jgi:large subunit ribosomal protein L9
MKVILLGELKGRGGEGDVVEVARGFAVNYLFPQKIAVEATPGNLKQLQARMHKITAREEVRLANANALKAKLEGVNAQIAARVGEEGQLFGSVTTTQIAEVLSELTGEPIDRKRIDLHHAIKQVGDHPAQVAIYREIKADVTVHVVDEAKPEGDEEAPEAEGVAAEATTGVAEAVADAAAVEAAPDAASAADAPAAEAEAGAEAPAVASEPELPTAASTDEPAA